MPSWIVNVVFMGACWHLMNGNLQAAETFLVLCVCVHTIYPQEEKK